jgi:chromosome segregation ATPase
MPELTKMTHMDKTFKLRAYSDTAKKDVSHGNRAEEKNKSQELAKKDALLAEERSKSHELLKTILQLRESLKQEQTKAAELQAKVNKLAVVEENQLVKKNAQLEEEKSRSLELKKTTEHLRESVKQEQANNAEMVKKIADLKAKLNKLAAVEESQLVKKNAQLEEEKKKSLDYIRMIEQLRGSIKQDQAKKVEMANKLAVLETKVRELSVVLSKISSIAAGGKLDSNG